MQSGDPFSALSGIASGQTRPSSSAEPFAAPPPQQQQQGGMDGMAPGGGYNAQMMRPGGPASEDEARRGAMSLQASLVRLRLRAARCCGAAGAAAAAAASRIGAASRREAQPLRSNPRVN